MPRNAILPKKKRRKLGQIYYNLENLLLISKKKRKEKEN